MAITMDGIFVNGQKALFRPEDIIDGDVSAYAEAVGSAVEEWMEENVTGGEQVTDTTLTLPGVPADAEVTGNKFSSLKEDLNANALNLTGGIDITKQYQNGWIATNTSTIDITNTHPANTLHKYVCIECNAGDKFQVFGESGSNIYGLTAFVASDGTRLAYSSTSLTDYKEFVAPANTKYFVSNVVKASPYGLIKGTRIKGEFDALGIATTGWNMYVDADATGGYVGNDGSFNGPSSTYKERTSDYIPISEGDELNIKVWATPATASNKIAIGVCTYDSDKTFITRSQKEGTAGGTYYKTIFTVPSGVSYVRIYGRFYNDGKMMVTKGSYDLGYIPAFKDNASAKAFNALSANVDGVNDGIASVTANTILTGAYTEGYIRTHMSTVDITDVYPNSDYKHLVVSCEEGDIFNIIGKGSDATHGLYVFIDANGTALSSEKSVTYTTFKQFSAPEDAVKLVSNVKVSDPYALIKGVFIKDRVSAIEARSASNTGAFSPLLRPAGPKFAMHRGVSTQAPENTIPAFELAGQGGAWGIETDVYETTDGYFVLSHDNDVSRMTDGTGKITEMTYAQTQECTIDAGSNIEQYPDLKMPLLEDYLGICRRYGSVPVIEIKGVTNYDNLVDVVKQCGMEGSSMFIFYYDVDVITTIRTMTSMPIAVIGSLNTDVEDLIDKASAHDDVWVDIYSTTVTDAVLQYAHSKNVPVGDWAIDNQSSADSLFRRGVDFITSNSITKLSS